MQNVSVSLEDLHSGTTIATQIGETTKASEAQIGLRFDPFRRAMLLAQNDFATLLRAKQDERACLLEALTSTEVYSVVSPLAYERWATERSALEELGREAAALRLFPPR